MMSRYKAIADNLKLVVSIKLFNLYSQLQDYLLSIICLRFVFPNQSAHIRQIMILSISFWVSMGYWLIGKRALETRLPQLLEPSTQSYTCICVDGTLISIT